MFDRLIITEPEKANIKNRRGYFMVSTFGVGIALSVAVVVSIFAADFTLGTNDFEITTLLAPVNIAPAAPEPPRQQPQPQTSAPTTNKLPTRVANIQNIIETPREAPPISATPSTLKARPETGRFEMGKLDSDPVLPGTSGRDTTGTGTGPSGGGLTPSSTVAETKPDPIPPPPPVRSPTPARKLVQSKGVVNGLATSLPRPHYPPAAKAMRAEGAVSVKVLIDEAGRVVSANAVNGHPLLRDAAESAARDARFTPTMLSDVPVKVSGTIVYNFSLS
ncbi:MAG: energy transducer TonB [Chloracidobacterium sp.]|nr:energy transducer TonB [Chloracidobacterium sp.]